MHYLNRNHQLLWQNRVKLFSFLSILGLIAFSLFWIKNLLLSFVLAIIISYLLSPGVSRLEGAGLSRTTAASLVFTTFFILTGLIIWAVSPFISNQASSMQNEFPTYLEKAMQVTERIQFWTQNLFGGTFKFTFSKNMESFFESLSKDAILRLPQFLSSSASVMILSPFIGFFILRDGRTVSRRLLSIIPNSIFEVSINLFHQINSQIGQYFRARLLESLIVGAIVLVGLIIIGLKYAFVLAIFAGVTNLIPYIGPLVGAVPAVLVALTGSDPQFTFFLVLVIYAIAQLVDMFFIIPLVVAKIVDLHPVTVILAVIVGAQLLGVLGMLISIPVFSAFKVTLVSIYRHVTDFG